MLGSGQTGQTAGTIKLPAEQIALICRRFHVQRLDLVGSAARGSDFDPQRSDLDFLVTFEPGYEGPPFSEFLALQDALAMAAGRRVDLISDASVRNPYIRASMARDRITVHEA